MIIKNERTAGCECTMYRMEGYVVHSVDDSLIFGLSLIFSMALKRKVVSAVSKLSDWGLNEERGLTQNLCLPHIYTISHKQLF